MIKYYYFSRNKIVILPKDNKEGYEYAIALGHVMKPWISKPVLEITKYLGIEINILRTGDVKYILVNQSDVDLIMVALQNLEEYDSYAVVIHKIDSHSIRKLLGIW